ncbi:chitinase [Cellulosimicrobium cellulans]|uniref:glycosyl hydrolase family 18 protein n=1 Tax=Cellulosimicrobium cellulans TaxID=1710 RepID=UPI00195BAA47|nr:glycosyl hydrolase family 18 protein [Cellulosimicrobium cellulans]MBM7819465.1 chitinase [Cellulosimicrobium cellulans]
MFRRKLLTLATTTALAVGAAVGLVAQPASAATPVPDHVFSPYYEMWLGDDISAVSQQAGADHVTLAFAQTERQGSCTLYWNGDTSLPIAQSSFGAQVDAIQARGGNVIPSLGGWTADDATEDGQLTELADSCTDVNTIAAQIEKLITTYDVERIDFDIEADSINSSAGVDRRNKALKIVQDWAKANGRTFEVQYTLPTTTQGLAAAGKNLTCCATP